MKKTLDFDIKKIQSSFEKFIAADSEVLLAREIKKSEKIPFDRAISIYKNNYNRSLISTLKDTYHACLQVLGESVFDKIAQGYVVTERSTKPLLSEYGEGFFNYLKSTPIIDEIPFIAELARFELALKKIILTDFSSKKENNHTVELAKHVCVFSSIHPVSELWEIITSKQEMDLPKLENNYYIIEKFDAGCKTVCISEEMYLFLGKLPFLRDNLTKSDINMSYELEKMNLIK